MSIILCVFSTAEKKRCSHARCSGGNLSPPLSRTVATDRRRNNEHAIVEDDRKPRRSAGESLYYLSSSVSITWATQARSFGVRARYLSMRPPSSAFRW